MNEHLLENKEILKIIKKMAKDLAAKQSNPLIEKEDLESEGYLYIMKNYDGILASPNPFLSAITNARNGMINYLRKYNREKGMFEQLPEEKDGD